MTSQDVALTWFAIYHKLLEEFPKDGYLWDFKDLHQIVTELTVAMIRSSK